MCLDLEKFLVILQVERFLPICTMSKKLTLILTLICSFVLGWTASAQSSYVRYVKPEDFGTKTLYADSVLTSITMPRGVSKLSNYYKFNVAAFELFQVLEDPDIDLMQVWVCGSASPDGLWADNVRLSEARTRNAVDYIKSVMNIPDYMIHAESLNEDWDKLAELVQESDLPFKYEVLYIIRTKDWGERKKALQKLDGGRVWRILEEDFFPQLRCVRFAIFCKWDPSKPYLSEPVSPVAPKPEPVTEPEPVQVDTVFVRDTVVMIKETVVVEKPVQEEPAPVEPVYTKAPREVKYHDTPWMIGVKTNLVADAIAIPMAGLEFQIGKRVSLDLQGWYSKTNIFCKEDETTNIYGFAPEIRFWSKDNAMQRGSFLGLHANVAWYTLQWTDGYLYQNGAEGQYGADAGSGAPAWSIGLTYGYSLALDRKAHWGLEFLVGVGYGDYRQNLGSWNEADGKWYIHEHQNATHIGITRAAINLTYRFSARRVKPEYYENR